MSAGTVVFNDLVTEENNPTLGLRPACLVMTRVVSHPTPNLVTLDVGSKGIAAEAGDPCGAILGYPHMIPQKVSEEHMPCYVTDGKQLKRGEAVYVFPRHVCPSVNLHEQAVLVDGKDYTVIDIKARAHELLADGY